MRTSVVAALAVVLLVLSAPAYVHHSGAMFDRTRQTQVTGTVTTTAPPASPC